MPYRANNWVLSIRIAYSYNFIYRYQVAYPAKSVSGASLIWKNCKYAVKGDYYGHEGMIVRAALTCIDNNKNMSQNQVFLLGNLYVISEMW
jgi:hypothetical protein